MNTIHGIAQITKLLRQKLIAQKRENRKPSPSKFTAIITLTNPPQDIDRAGQAGEEVAPAHGATFPRGFLRASISEAVLEWFGYAGDDHGIHCDEITAEAVADAALTRFEEKTRLSCSSKQLLASREK